MNHKRLFLFTLVASFFPLVCHSQISQIQKAVTQIDSIISNEPVVIDKSSYQFTHWIEESGIPIGVEAKIYKLESTILYAEFDIVGDLAGNQQQCYFENGRLIYGKRTFWSQSRNNIVEKREFFYKGNSQPVFQEQSIKSDTKAEYEKAAFRFESSVTELLQYIKDNVHFFNTKKIIGNGISQKQIISDSSEETYLYDKIVRIFGKPLNIQESKQQSRHSPGDYNSFKILTFDGMTIYLIDYFDGKNEDIIKIEVTGKNQEIAFDLTVGTTMAKIVEVLGEPYEQDEDSFVYLSEASFIRFYFDNQNKTTKIEWRFGS